MPSRKRRLYEKQPPFRDATLFVIICEGEKREPAYFEYFDGLTSRIKVRAVASVDGKSAPTHLLDNANDASRKYDLAVDDELWFLMDIDRWINHIHFVQDQCATKHNWFIALSNPCFEVWLYCHFSDAIPAGMKVDECTPWKQLIPSVIDGGFNAAFHPSLIAIAIENATKAYRETGYIPEPGCSQVFRLAEKIYPLIRKRLEEN